MELLTLLLLVLLNAVLVLSEMSVVSSRRLRLERWTEEGRPGAAAALQLATEPAHFLSTVQIGMSAIGIFSGALSEATLSGHVAEFFAGFGVAQPYAGRLALVIVVAVVSSCYLLFGELVPKRLALRNPESIASALAPVMQSVTRLAFPLVKAFSAASDAVLRLFRTSPQEPLVTEEDINVLMEQGAQAGVFERQEQVMVSRVLGLDERRVASAMTPRGDIVWLDLNDPFEVNRQKMLVSPHSRFPLCKDGLTDVIGVVDARSLLEDAFLGRRIDLANRAEKPLYVPEVLTVMKVLETFKKHRQHFALVVDEYGELQGLVTMSDIMETLVGDIATVEYAAEPDIVRRDDGSLLVDGSVSPERFKEATGLEEPLPAEESGSYQTLGGFTMLQLEHIPQVGDKFESCGFRFEVLDMDGNRVDKLLVTRLAASGPKADAGETARS